MVVMTNEFGNRSADGRYPVRRFYNKPDQPDGVDQTRRISEVITRLLAKLGIEQDLWLSELKTEWPSVVGEVVARHTRPGQLIGRTLIVFVDSPVWLNELQRYSLTEMLANLQNRFGPQRIQALRLSPDPDGTRDGRRSASS